MGEMSQSPDIIRIILSIIGKPHPSILPYSLLYAPQQLVSFLLVLGEKFGVDDLAPECGFGGCQDGESRVDDPASGAFELFDHGEQVH